MCFLHLIWHYSYCVFTLQYIQLRNKEQLKIAWFWASKNTPLSSKECFSRFKILGKNYRGQQQLKKIKTRTKVARKSVSKKITLSNIQVILSDLKSRVSWRKKYVVISIQRNFRVFFVRCRKTYVLKKLLKWIVFLVMPPIAAKQSLKFKLTV